MAAKRKARPSGAQEGNLNNFGTGVITAGLRYQCINFHDYKRRIKRGEGVKNICKAIFKKALDGDMAAINFMADRLEGKVQSNVHVTGTITHEIMRGIDLDQFSDDELTAMAEGVIPPEVIRRFQLTDSRGNAADTDVVESEAAGEEAVIVEPKGAAGATD